jgi:RecA/RadA recombinase
MIQTEVPMVNVALSGSLDGGFTSGLTMLAGPSKHFKTAFALLFAASYLKKYKDAVVLFYDSEFGTPQKYFETFGIDQDRVLHTPITDVEELKHDIMNQLQGLGKDDKVIIVLDSIGNLASKKEIDDTLEGKTVADMTRAKQIKSLFRMVTPHLTIKDVPMIVVNHTYMEMGLYPKAIVSGGCVVAGTKIQTKDDIKCIEDFNEGDLVITALGERKVTHVWNPQTLEQGVKDCYEIVFEDGSSVVCSEDHKFFVDSSWVEAKKLKEGQDCLSV